MYRPTFLLAICITILLAVVAPGLAQTKAAGASSSAQANRVHFIKAFVIDERLSALRQEADIHSPVIKRLRVGHAVYVIQPKTGQSEFYRVAVTRRTRGWIAPDAIVIPGRAGEDERLLRIIQETGDGVDRIALCELFLVRFSRSAQAPRALLVMGEAAGRAATSLTQHARRRLKGLDEQAKTATAENFYLNDPGLDRYSRLHVAFHFDPSQTRFAYDGRAYRDILRRYPQSAEAQVAQRRLDTLASHLAKEK